MNYKQAFKDIWHNKTVLRSLMNERVRAEAISGTVIDVGGGINPEYHAFFKAAAGTKFTTVDLKENSQGIRLDLEKDLLPFPVNSADAVLMFNLLEHIYNHAFVVGEAHRIIKKGGRLIGFVPFLINYHPDPHDYFRYTREALDRIFSDIGFTNIQIEEIGGGPFIVNYNNVVLSMPRVARITLFPIYAALDKIFLYFRPGARKRFPLGYFFTARK